MSIIRDINLAEMGRKKIEWAKSYMPVLNEIKKDFVKTKPFKGLTITTSVHLEAKTACLALLLTEGGAEVHATGCNPLSTHDDVAAGLSTMGVNVFAWHNCTPEEYKKHLSAALSCHPHLILDDGGDLTELLHGFCRAYGDRLIGGTEETTTGVLRHKQRAANGQLSYPIIAVNDADMKHLFDNRYGTGESVWSAIMNTTNIQVTGKTVVVAGYGWCGRGVAMRAAGLGANVIVTEIDSIKAIEAVMDGFRVMKMDDAAPLGDFFCTVTGCKDVIVDRHFSKMKDVVFLTNAGHFDCEVDVAWLRSNSEGRIIRRPNIEGFVQEDGRILNVLCEGRLVNLAAGNGHPVEIMDMSFGVQALALEYLVKNGKGLSKGVYPVAPEIDARVAEIRLRASDIGLDILTEEQVKYLQQF